MDINVKKIPVRNIIFAILIIGVIVFISIKYTPFIISIVSNTEEFRSYILSFGNTGVLMLVAFQISHIIIPVIPGELVQIAGGYIYGTVFGMILLIIGTAIGSIIVFYLSRVVGYPSVRFFVSESAMEKFKFLSNSSKIEITIFILFLIPGIPKDALIYIAGLTPIKPLRFLLISLIARTPGIIGSAFIGANILERDYKSALILASIAILCLIAGIIFRKKLLRILNTES